MEKYECDVCNRIFKRRENLKYHKDNKSCKIKNFECTYCSKTFTTNNSMYRHMKHNCTIKKQDDVNRKEIYGRLLKLEKENDELKQKMRKMEKDIKMNCTNIKNSTVNINNGTINNIILAGCGKEDISKIDRNELLKGIRSGFYATIRLTDTIHFNPKYPEYHNVINIF